MIFTKESSQEGIIFWCAAIKMVHHAKIPAKNIVLERGLCHITKNFKERFNCCEESFKASKEGPAGLGNLGKQFCFFLRS